MTKQGVLNPIAATGRLKKSEILNGLGFFPTQPIE